MRQKIRRGPIPRQGGDHLHVSVEMIMRRVKGADLGRREPPHLVRIAARVAGQRVARAVQHPPGLVPEDGIGLLHPRDHLGVDRARFLELDAARVFQGHVVRDLAAYLLVGEVRPDQRTEERVEQFVELGRARGAGELVAGRVVIGPRVELAHAHGHQGVEPPPRGAFTRQKMLQSVSLAALVVGQSAEGDR